MLYAVQQLLNALPIASLYAALAFGYAIAFAVTRRADITYGALFAFSGHVFLLAAHFGWNRLFLTFPAALLLGAAFAVLLVAGGGVAIGRHVVAPLSHVAPNALTVASLGLLLVLMEAARLASGTRELWLPPFLNLPLPVWRYEGGTASLTLLQGLNSLVLVLLVVGGGWFLAVSRFGRNWRAVCDDPLAAELLGVHVGRICAGAYGLAALFAALAGILATAHYGTMDFGAGLVFGLKVLLIAAAGGHSHPLRAAAGAALFGLGETLWSGYGPLAWRDAVMLGALVALLVVSRRERVLV
ncbi:branched-chain amino acid ABC transporter permease [Rhizobium sp. CSW-27]|uniref:branched-chain amino acid ABC transporter permease n=1 Tax=Rhizobium sp. CSW-27 TaxID=2839985 RepID=UPI001C034EC0|nr:branched-chain amino acid ABC transporter permease [Rhizobium sp. CSW-27]MBT9368434.1 branched-chain amino acid ABC transporter permease [Rhizobium sp. CSW-27]